MSATFDNIRQPHKGASKDTIARWVKEILKNSGVQKIHQRFLTP